MSRHFQPGTAAAFFVVWFSIGYTGGGLVDAIVADFRADRGATCAAVPASPITVAPAPLFADHPEVDR